MRKKIVEGRVSWLIRNLPEEPPKLSIGQHVVTRSGRTGVVMAQRKGVVVDDAEGEWHIEHEGLPYARDDFGFYMLNMDDGYGYRLTQFYHETEIEGVVKKPKVSFGTDEMTVIFGDAS